MVNCLKWSVLQQITFCAHSAVACTCTKAKFIQNKQFIRLDKYKRRFRISGLRTQPCRSEFPIHTPIHTILRLSELNIDALESVTPWRSNRSLGFANLLYSAQFPGPRQKWHVTRKSFLPTPRRKPTYTWHARFRNFDATWLNRENIKSGGKQPLSCRIHFLYVYYYKSLCA